jgi:hypothetical protein
MMPTDAAIYEVRAVQPDGSTSSAGLFARHAEAAEQARLLLTTGDARRVETWRRHDGREDLLSIIGEARRPKPAAADGWFRPQDQDDEDGVIG